MISAHKFLCSLEKKRESQRKNLQFFFPRAAHRADVWIINESSCSLHKNIPKVEKGSSLGSAVPSP